MFESPVNLRKTGRVNSFFNNPGFRFSATAVAAILLAMIPGVSAMATDRAVGENQAGVIWAFNAASPGPNLPLCLPCWWTVQGMVSGVVL